MKKKLILLSLFICPFLCGCTSIQDTSLPDIIAQGTEKKVSVYNTYRQGYKYNLPKGITSIDTTEYNEVLNSKDYTYYLYIDAVSYYNKVIETYKENQQAYYSKPISYEDKYGYIEINELKNGKYFIEIMYNYAKIEVIVKEKDIKATVANSLSILTSVDFNTNVLKTLLDEEESQFKELNFNIFDTNSADNSEFLQTIDDYIYQDEDEIHDTDLIN